MVECDSDYFCSSDDLVWNLTVNTKSDLVNIAKLLGVSIRSSLKKDDYVDTLSEVILACPDKWLCQLTHYELVLLQKLVKAGPNTYVEEPNPQYDLMLSITSLIITDQKAPGKVRYMICDDLREAIASYLDAALAEKEKETQIGIEEIALGILNLYGILPFAELADKVCLILSGAVTRAEVMQQLQKSLLMKYLVLDVVGEFNRIPYAHSPFLTEISELLDELDMRREIAHPKPFPKEELIQAGGIPIVRIPCPKTGLVKDLFVQQMGFSEEQADFYLSFLWLEMQFATNPMSVITSRLDLSLLPPQKLHQAIDLLVGYCNSCPRWILRGFSPEEASQLIRHTRSMQTPPQLIVGPGLKASGLDITKIQAEFDRLINERISEQKMGRNDLCPCGSGKKYKKCCGKE